MKIFLLRLFLSLYLLFPGGYGALYFHTSPGSAHHSSTFLLKKSEKASFAGPQKSLAQASSIARSGFKTAPFKLKATQEKEEEEEEQETASFKKQSSTSAYFSAYFWAHALSYFFSFSKGILPFSRHIAFIPPANRQLLFQVFRI